jgi:hypothetical protein
LYNVTEYKGYCVQMGIYLWVFRKTTL